MGKIRAYRCLLASVLVGQAERPTEQINQRRLKHPSQQSKSVPPSAASTLPNCLWRLQPGGLTPAPSLNYRVESFPFA
jgi:hypothetical protein